MKKKKKKKTNMKTKTKRSKIAAIHIKNSNANCDWQNVDKGQPKLMTSLFPPQPPKCYFSSSISIEIIIFFFAYVQK